MASPITLYIIPDCGLQIKVEKDGISENNSSNIPYTIETALNDGLYLKNQNTNKEFKGTMSPIHFTTLPRKVKEGAGIPEKAKFFSFLHPPTKLANAIEWKEWERENDGKLEAMAPSRQRAKKGETVSNPWAKSLISIIGAFVYFDEHKEVVSVNAISLRETIFDLRLSGPFDTREEAMKEVKRSNRGQPLLVNHFHEAGFVASAWIRPMELFQAMSPIQEKEGQVMKDCRHGGLMFFRDDGSSIIYIIENSGYVDFEGNTSSLADAFQEKQEEICKLSDLEFSSDLINLESEDKMNHVKEKINMAYNFNGKDRMTFHRAGVRTLRETLDDKKSLLHMAFRVKCSNEVIMSLLEDESDNLLYQNPPYKWTPLHYACRFKIEEKPLILAMIKKCPESVSVKDKYNRTALHIACENCQVSPEILKALLDADKESSIFQQTKHLQRLPIHISCYHNASESIISCLLENDVKGKSLSTTTAAGRMPLHMAVERKLPAESIRCLLELNLRDQFNQEVSSGSIELGLNGDEQKYSRTRKALYHRFDDLLPLHIACLNNSSPQTIQILLDSDYKNRTVFDKIDKSSWYIDLLDEDDRKSFNVRKDNDDKGSTVGNDQGDKRGTVALHLAAVHSNKDVIDLLLHKEKLSKDSKHHLTSSVQLQDKLGKSPLHIACESKNANPAVIQQLLDADNSNRTIHMKDKKEYKAIHYTCDRDDANHEILCLLLKAEESYLESFSKESRSKPVKRMTKTCDDRYRSPLYLAVQSEADDKILETLMQPKDFYLKGFDHRLVTVLANRSVKNTKLQDLIIEKMTERCYFNLLFLDVYANACALWFFLRGSEKMLTQTSRKVDPYMLMFCLCVFIFRTIIQIKSEPSHFVADPWNWCQVLYIVLLAKSVESMLENIGKTEMDFNRDLLIITCSLLIAQFTFFLKATFLPFARFVGGLLTIFNTLIPFFIVSALLLLAFTFGFRMSEGSDADCDTLLKCYFWTLQSFFSGSEETSGLLDVLFGIIAIVVLLNVLIAIVSEGEMTRLNQL